MTYFKPWMRKFGLLAVMMACLSMGGWVRSRTFSDTVMFQTRKPRQSTSSSLTSCDRGLVWIRRVHLENELSQMHATPVSPPPWITFHSGISGNDSFASQLDDGSIWDSYWKGYVWKWYGFRFDTGDKKTHLNSLIRISVIPYWSIVLPLTLLSAYLLLSKPRHEVKASPKGGNEP